MGLVAPVNAKDGKEKQWINIATLAGKMETQLGNGGRANKPAGEGDYMKARVALQNLCASSPHAPSRAHLGTAPGSGWVEKSMERPGGAMRICCRVFGAKNHEILSICQRARSRLQKLAR